MYQQFPTFIPSDRQDGLAEVLGISGGRSSAFTLLSLINGGFGLSPEHYAIFENTGQEDETCYKFLHEIEQNTGIKVHMLEYTLTPKFIEEILQPDFDYDKFNNCGYTSIEQILKVEKLRSFEYKQSQNNFWYKDKYSDKELNIKEVDYYTASRNGKPFTDLFLYKCAIRIMKGKGLLLPSVGQRWCTGDMKEKVCERWLSLKGIKQYISYKGMRFDEPDRVRKVNKKNDEQDDIWYYCPLHNLKIKKIDVLMAWGTMPFDLGLSEKIKLFIDCIGNCIFCHLKSKIKKLYLIQKGFKVAFWKQVESLANNYNGDVDAMSRQHGTYEMLEKEANEVPEITIEQVLSDAELEISCFGCTD